LLGFSILILPFYAINTIALLFVGLVATDSTLGTVGVSRIILHIVARRACHTFNSIVAEFAMSTNGAFDGSIQGRYRITWTFVACLDQSIVAVLVKA
jgi:hypothetical protein